VTLFQHLSRNAGLKHADVLTARLVQDEHVITTDCYRSHARGEDHENAVVRRAEVEQLGSFGTGADGSGWPGRKERRSAGSAAFLGRLLSMLDLEPSVSREAKILLLARRSARRVPGPSRGRIVIAAVLRAD